MAKPSKSELERIFGKIQVVTSFPDYKVEIVTAFEDIKVKLVDSFPDKPGKWQLVTAFPDFKIQIVTAFPDFKIRCDSAFPGLGKASKTERTGNSSTKSVSAKKNATKGGTWGGFITLIAVLALAKCVDDDKPMPSSTSRTTSTQEPPNTNPLAQTTEGPAQMSEEVSAKELAEPVAPNPAEAPLSAPAEAPMEPLDRSSGDFRYEAVLVDSRGKIVLQSKPAITSKNVAVLPAGVHVRSESTEGKWIRVKTADGIVGFVRGKQLEHPAAEETGIPE